jgi:hypothetical protein
MTNESQRIGRVLRKPPKLELSDYVPLPEPVTSWSCMRAKQLKEEIVTIKILKSRVNSGSHSFAIDFNATDLHIDPAS